MSDRTSEFEFIFEEATSAVEDVQEELEEMVPELVDKSEVIIFTNNYRVHGKIALVPGARLTDYIVEANLFIAVTEVEVTDRENKFILKTPFLNVHRDHIELILPAEFSTVTVKAGRESDR
jgi:hypothetical protein